MEITMNMKVDQNWISDAERTRRTEADKRQRNERDAEKLELKRARYNAAIKAMAANPEEVTEAFRRDVAELKRMIDAADQFGPRW